MAGKRRAVVNLWSLRAAVLSDRWARPLLVLATALVVLSVILEAGIALKPYVDRPVQDRGWDVDWHYFIANLNQVHEFKDTLRWWTGPWCGLAPYWRPLSAYVLWAEHVAWGPQYMLPRQIILVALHLCLVALAWLLLSRLTNRRWLILLTVWLFAGCRPHPISDVFDVPESVLRVLCDPKNVPEPIVGIAVIAGLLLIMRGKWISALMVAAIGVGFKELSFATWPLALAVLAWRDRDRVFASGGLHYVRSSLRRNRVPVIVWSAVFLALFVAHVAAVGFGATMDLRMSTPIRFALYFGGPIAVGLIMHDPSAAYVGLLAYGSLVVSRGRSLLFRFVIMLIALGAGMLLDTRLQGVTWGVSMARLLSWRLDLTVVLACLIWLLVVETALRDRQAVALGMGLCLIASGPTWIGLLALEHSRYLASFFMEVAVAAALIVSLKVMSGRMPVTKVKDTT